MHIIRVQYLFMAVPFLLLLEVKFIYHKVSRSYVYHSVSFDKCIHLCNPKPYKITEHNHHPRKWWSWPFSCPFLPTETIICCDFFHCILILPFGELHVSRIVHCVLLCKTSFKMQSKIFCLMMYMSAACSFLLLCGIPLHVCVLALMDTRAVSRLGLYSQ